VYPDEFDYYRAESVEHAVDLLADHPDADILAGGHSLLPTMKSGLAEPDVLVDIGEIDELKQVTRASETTTIGAIVRYADVLETTHLRGKVPVLTDAVEVIGDVQVRNRGTIGGNLAHADPASDLPAPAVVADATLVVTGPDGERTIDAEDFFLGMYMTDLGSDEILTRIEVPHEPDGAASAYVKKPSPSSGYALVGVAARLTVEDGTVVSARVAVNGVVGRPARLSAVEEALDGSELTESERSRAAEHATESLDETMMMDDLQASAEYRANLVRTYTERALERATDRLEGEHHA